MRKINLIFYFLATNRNKNVEKLAKFSHKTRKFYKIKKLIIAIKSTQTFKLDHKIFYIIFH